MTDRSALFETFGCRLNAYETDVMRGAAESAGLENAVVVNTCAVTAEAVRQAEQRIRRVRRDRPEARIVVTGCAAQIDPQRFAAMPEVDAVVGNAEKLRAETWRDLASRGPRWADDGAIVKVDDVFAASETAPQLMDGFGARARAFVQIQNGCDHRCTFCVIPFGRGRSRSAPTGEIVHHVRRLVDAGRREVVLSGVDITSWGADLPALGGRRPRLGELVQRILTLVPDLPRLRLSSIDNAEADPALMDALESDARLTPHLHLSLQSGDDLILKRMKRRHSRDDAVRFCQEARRRRPDIVFGADLIVGFPTETDAMFDNTCALAEDCGLTHLHVFPYSPRPQTPAARMPQVEKSTIKVRAASLRALGDARRAAHLRRQVGRTVRVLMERPRFGRADDFSEVAFDETAAGAALDVGALFPARIVDADASRLRAQPIGSESDRSVGVAHGASIDGLPA